MLRRAVSRVAALHYLMDELVTNHPELFRESTVANWNGSGYPDAGGLANLGTILTAAATVNLDVPVTLSSLQLTTNSATLNYTVTGTNAMTLTGAGTVSLTGSTGTLSIPMLGAFTRTGASSTANVRTIAVTAPFTLDTVVEPGYGRSFARPPKSSTAESVCIRECRLWSASV